MKTAKELKAIMKRLDKMAGRLEGLGFHDQALAVDKAQEALEDVQDSFKRL